MSHDKITYDEFKEVLEKFTEDNSSETGSTTGFEIESQSYYHVGNSR